MKKILFVMLMAMASMVYAQVKPSIPKAEKALKEGKLAEAKSIIDATTASQEFMVDKKGKPSKNAAKAYYIKALVYFAIDTTRKEEFKSLDPNPFAVAKEAFERVTRSSQSLLATLMMPAVFLCLTITSR